MSTWPNLPDQLVGVLTQLNRVREVVSAATNCSNANNALVTWLAMHRRGAVQRHMDQGIDHGPAR
jgi:hypothetical protein